MNFKTDSSETVGRISSRASGGTNSSQPQKPKKARASTNRGELELDQPLDRLQPVAAKRGAVYPPASKAVKRSFCLNTTLGILMIALLVFGSIFGVVIAVIETHGALSSISGPPTSASSDTLGPSAPSVVTTLVPSSFSTLVPSSFSTLVPSEVTIYVPSDATTLVPSDATTLIASVVTLSQRAAIAPTELAGIDSTTDIEQNAKITSTTGFVMSITSTVTVAVYSTTFGRYDLENEPSSNGDSQQTCGNGAQNACMSTTNIAPGIQSTFVTSTLSTATTSLVDLNFTTATTVMPDSAATTTTTTTDLQEVSVDKVTITFSMMCAVADVSSLLPCNPVPTGWYISPSPPRATSFLHPIFRFISSCLFRVTDTSNYQFLRLSVTIAWNQCGKVFVNAGGGKVVDSVFSLISNRRLTLKMWENIGHLRKTIGRIPPRVLPREE